MILWVYDKWGNQKNALKWFFGFVHDDEIGNLDFIEFDLIGESIDKYDYIVWQDEFGVWHEHFVRETNLNHSEGKVLQHVYAVNSIAELNLSYVNERDSYNFNNNVAWTRLLEGTRWTLGKVDNLGLNDVKFYHTTVYDGAVLIMDKWGGDLSTTVTVGSQGVIQRRVNHEAERGEDNGLLFTYGFDMGAIERKIELDDVYTKIHVFGKGEPTFDDAGTQTGNGRRISFADINGGKDYVEDNVAKEKWGIEGKNGWQHSEGTFVFDDCEDKEQLLELAYQKLDEVKKPRVTYTANVAMLKAAGMEFKNAKAGDKCNIRDKVIDERLSGRIIHVRRFIEQPAEITLGNIVRTINDTVKGQQRQINSLQNQSSRWSSAAEANRDWLKNMQNHWNEVMNENGGFVYIEEGEGITVYDKKRENNPTMAIQLKGAGFRIANSKKSNGDWDWKTFGTGDGFTADLINVGSLVCGSNRIDLDAGVISFVNGVIQDLGGSGNYWNLGTGEFRLAYNTTIGDKTVSQYVTEGVSDFVNNVYDPKIADLQKQIDGQIETWYYDYEPKLTNKPASDWNTEAKKEAHEGDLFYWKSKGYAYRFFKDGSTWVWQMVQDTDITQAMAKAAEAQDTADQKRRVFVSEPKPPYDVGDLWTQGADGDLMRCAVGRKTGSYIKSDWILATSYIDQAAADSVAKDAAEAAVNSQTQADIFNRLTDNGAAKGIYLESNQLYINSTYIQTGTITSEGGSTWNLETGDFKTIFVVDYTQTNYTNYTRYVDQVVEIDMGAAEPFAIYTGQRNRDVYKNGNPTKYYDVTNKKFAGGIVLSSSNKVINSSSAYLMASRVGISNTNYITTGVTSQGNAGASFMSSAKEYLTLESTYAVDDKTQASTGVGFMTQGKAFGTASTYYNHVWFYPPNKANYTDSHPAYIFVDTTEATLSQSATRYIKVASSGISLVQSATAQSNGSYIFNRYILLDGSSVTVQNSASRYITLGGSSTTICDASTTSGSTTTMTRYLYMSSGSSTFKHSANTYLYLESGSATLWGNTNACLYVSSGSASLRTSSTNGIFIDSSSITIQVATNYYIYLSTSACYVRFGSKGLSATSSSLEWSSVNWS